MPPWQVLCALEGAVGGVLGAVFNRLFISVQRRRPRRADPTWPVAERFVQHLKQLAEVAAVSVLATVVMFTISRLGAELGWSCHEQEIAVAHVVDPSGGPELTITDVDPGLAKDWEKLQFYCPQNDDDITVSTPLPNTTTATFQYNGVATVFFTSRENALLQMIESPQDFSYYSLLLIGVVTFCLTLLSFGAAIPAGVFMPTIMMGVAFGGFYGKAVKDLTCVLACVLNPACDCFSGIDHGAAPIAMSGPYALLGAVAMLGGIQRSSLSLVVIIVEGTGKIDYLLPIIITTVAAKWVGDTLNMGPPANYTVLQCATRAMLMRSSATGLYHTALEMKGIPFLEALGSL
jgi:H+/Cl- antiporter ClcA